MPAKGSAVCAEAAVAERHRTAATTAVALMRGASLFASPCPRTIVQVLGDVRQAEHELRGAQPMCRAWHAVDERGLAILRHRTRARLGHRQQPFGAVFAHAGE